MFRACQRAPGWGKFISVVFGVVSVVENLNAANKSRGLAVLIAIGTALCLLINTMLLRKLRMA